MPESRRGFAAMDAEKQREIAKKGGRAAHAKGSAHQFSADEARVAGRKGGQTVSQNREYMARIGRKGGEVSGMKRGSRPQTEETSMAPGAESGAQEPSGVEAARVG